jgi:nucleoside-diphosphate-sugar epimerase
MLTGADGYLGSAIMREADRQDVEVVPATLADGDLRYAGAARVLLTRHKPDVVIHCAARLPKYAYHYNSDQSDNLGMVENLLPGTHRFVFASSMAVHANNAYGTAKRNAELMIGERGVSLRLPGLFGAPRRAGMLYNAACTFLRGSHFMVRESVLWSPFHVRTAAACCLAAVEWPHNGPVDIAYPSLPTYELALNLLWVLCGRRGSYDVPGYKPNLERFTMLALPSIPNLAEDLEALVEWVKGHS